MGRLRAIFAFFADLAQHFWLFATNCQVKRLA
jgi:hypothetical protein